MKMNYGVMEMRKMIEPKLGPNSPLILSPGNDHLMLFGLSKDLNTGQNLDLIFLFKDQEGNEITKKTSSLMLDSFRNSKNLFAKQFH